MAINDRLDMTDSSNQLPSINHLLQTAQSDVSFWGTRVVTATAYEGSFSLDALASKVLQAGQSGDLTAAERASGIEITNKLRTFYKVTNTKVSQANWFTRLLIWVREFTFYPYTPRFHTEEGLMEDYFKG